MQNSQDFQRDLAAVSLDAIVGEPLTGSGFETDEPELTDPYSEKELVCYYLGELSPNERDGRRPGEHLPEWLSGPQLGDNRPVAGDPDC